MTEEESKESSKVRTGFQKMKSGFLYEKKSMIFNHYLINYDYGGVVRSYT